MNKWINNIHNWLFPSTCLLCGASGVQGLDLCQGCIDTLPVIDSACYSCGLPLPSGTTGSQRCGQCLKQPPAFDRTVSLFRYQAPVAGLVQQLKFNGRLNNARTLGQLLARHVSTNSLPLPQAILPVPLHSARLRERGFNQALELARPLARTLELPLLIDHCQRIRATTAQTSLPANQRRRNLRGAFKVTRPFTTQQTPIKHIALVDDVMTTGQTLNELARTLRKSGVNTIDVWVCARAELTL